MSARGLRIDEAQPGGDPFAFQFEGRPVSALAGETVATALLAAGVRRLRDSPRDGRPRGMTCAIGVCQECVVVVDGRTLPACQLPAREGLRVFEKRRP